MKKIKIFSTCFGLVVLFTNLYFQTTQEEYNYITKGYKIQLDSGLDMKKDRTLPTLRLWG